ncbi:MAG: hypothetical protein K2N74_05715, partial [Clostridiales bacterium]|nr:hypothetical protein [Clostridiales bacterium]
LKLNLNGKAIDGKVCLDLSDMSKIDVRAKLGDLSVWYAGDTAYLSYKGLKVSLSVNELMGLLGGLTAPSEGEAEAEETDLLSSIFIVPDDGFTFTETSAKLHAVLSLKQLGINLEIPVDFAFALEKKTDALNRVSFAVSLENIKADITLKDFNVGVEVAFGDGTLPALSEDEKGAFVELMPYVNSLLDLFTGDAVHADVNFASGDLSINGGLNLNLKAFAVDGALTVAYKGAKVNVGVIYENDVVYLALNDLKVKANVKEIVALVSELVAIPETDVNAGELLAKVFALDFEQLLKITEAEGTLTLAVNGTQLLSAFLGENAFALGDVVISVNQSALSLGVYGANVTVTKAEAFTPAVDGYSDLAEFLPYVKEAANIFTSELIRLDLSYSAEEFALAGAIELSLNGGLAASGSLTVTVPAPETKEGEEERTDATKTLSFIYSDGVVYLDLDGAKLKADTKAAVAFVKSYLGNSDGMDIGGLLGKLFTAEFNSNFEIEAGKELTAVVHGTELLTYLGLDFNLGDIVLGIGGNKITASVLGVSAEISGKSGKISAPAGEYRDLTPALNGIL